MREYKLQSVLEYMHTYAFAIVAIAVVVVLFYETGILNSFLQGPTAKPGSCTVLKSAFRVQSPPSLQGVCQNWPPEFTPVMNGRTNGAVIPMNHYLNITPANKGITIDLWMKSQKAQQSTLVSTSDCGYQLTLNRSSLQFLPGCGDRQYSFTGNFQPNKWYNLAVTLSPTSNTVNFYINGTLKATMGLRGSYIIHRSRFLYIGNGVAPIAGSTTLNFSGKNLQSANLSCLDLEGANFSGANLQYAIVKGSNISNANFQGANLQQALFKCSDGTGANFSGVNMQHADMLNSSLQSAIFKGANAQHANFSGSNLQNANFSGANLAKAQFDNSTQPICAPNICPVNKTQPTRISYFNGSISNVQIYNSSLSSSDMHALYMGGIGAEPISLQALAGWWPLNGDFNDYSGDSNSGTNSSNVTEWYPGH
ncbi:MAG: pentapeptide repeat-containing protein [Candidatus Micrarchaeota archaeon]|nr:pentapeptide repeat-containing protein [Candidatus Micrarchaeota archaeon]